MNKYENTRVVKVLEDFNPSKNEKENKPGRVLYKKGSEHAISYKLLEKLKAKGLKFTIKDVDFKKIEEQARLRLRAAKQNKE